MSRFTFDCYCLLYGPVWTSSTLAVKILTNTRHTTPFRALCEQTRQRLRPWKTFGYAVDCEDRMRAFHHIGLPAPDQGTPIPGESWVESSRCWVSNPAHHASRIEWLRYAPDSPIDPDFQGAPHVCYRVDDLMAALVGQDVVVPPFEPGDPPFGRAAFTREHGIIVEYIELYPGRAWFDDDLATDPG
jgi:hypothetical protein